jgi:hypothetical protein
MNNKLLLFVLLLSIISLIAAQENHMDIMTTMTGEHDWALMGDVMTTLDWNGDGHDDLVINENGWRPPEYIGNPNVRSYGKLNFYFGGTNFDNVPEITLPGSYQQEYLYTFSMCNARDMNGDGVDELALFRATMYEDNNDQNYDLQLCVFYGGATPDTIPDYVLTFPREEWDNTYGSVRGLGDINSDGHTELGYVIGKNYPLRSYTYGIVYGDSMTNAVFIEAGTTLDMADFEGLGDINADGVGDFCLGYKYIINQVRYSKVILYYGSPSEIYSDSLVICQGSDFSKPYAYPAGDLNWDGHPEFVSSFTNTSAKIYFGGPDFDGTQYIAFAPPYNGGNWNNGFAHGDVNGNGTSDLMGTNVSQSNGYGDTYLWMGGVPMNGIPDLHLTPSLNENSEMYGFCLTMGDYNADGCCDAAISAPFNYSGSPFPGKVFVYAGNPQLNDPTPNADDANTPLISKLQLYPNPLQPQNTCLNVRFTPLNPPSGRGVEFSTFEIFNIKGQKVKSFVISAEQAKSGSAIYHLNDLSSGVYVCVFTNGEMQHKGKITVIR